METRQLRAQRGAAIGELDAKTSGAPLLAKSRRGLSLPRLEPWLLGPHFTMRWGFVKSLYGIGCATY